MQPDALLLARVGVALYGPAWTKALAEALGVTPAMMSRVVHGHKPMPRDWPARLLALRPAREAQLTEAWALLREEERR